MKTRRFRGKNLRETLDKVKAALGEDAIIVSTRKVGRGSAGFGPDGESHVEVEATTPELEAPEENGFGAGNTEALVQDTEDIQEPDDLEELFREDIAPAGGADSTPGYSDLLYELCETGLSEETANEILLRAGEEAGASGDGSPEAHRERVRDMLSLLFEVKGPVAVRKSGDDGPAISNFLGPTGAGKTTTIAKIAARCTKRRLKVGLITLDTQRVGGVEQMRKLADLLRLPLIAARSRKQLEQAIAKFRQADVILVDSPGRSIGDEAGMSELEEFFGRDKVGENFLVLAANTHPGDLKRMGERFSRVPLDGVIFTKLDEASRFGVIFELHMDLGVPVAYITSGQKILGGLEEGSPKRLARLVLPADRKLASAQGAAI
ncbi:hypothetical protein ACFLQ0_00820 [Nitrospinota bacterium]